MKNNTKTTNSHWSKSDIKYHRRTRMQLEVRIENGTATQGDFQFYDRLVYIMKEYNE